MLARLDELEEDLTLRRARATTEGWLGEIEGIDLTPTFLSAHLHPARANRPGYTGVHDRTGAAEWRGLSPLFWTHIDPYGRFRLDMNTRLDLTAP
jgi:hypothetical protein